MTRQPRNKPGFHRNCPRFTCRSESKSLFPATPIACVRFRTQASASFPKLNTTIAFRQSWNRFHEFQRQAGCNANCVFGSPKSWLASQCRNLLFACCGQSAFADDQTDNKQWLAPIFVLLTGSRPKTFPSSVPAEDCQLRLSPQAWCELCLGFRRRSFSFFREQDSFR